ncbi:MAG: hypothetical protein EBR17_07085, partial [Betaproteobacteria bacterium]|nr:hypothetical protein [Betaproteobacteria bacterium]
MFCLQAHNGLHDINARTERVVRLQNFQALLRGLCGKRGARQTGRCQRGCQCRGFKQMRQRGQGLRS